SINLIAACLACISNFARSVDAALSGNASAMNAKANSSFFIKFKSLGIVLFPWRTLERSMNLQADCHGLQGYRDRIARGGLAATVVRTHRVGGTPGSQAAIGVA